MIGNTRHRICGTLIAVAGLLGCWLIGPAAGQPLSLEEAQRRQEERKAAADKAAAEAAARDAARQSPESAEVWNLLANTSGSYVVPDPIPDPPAPLTLEQLAKSRDKNVAAVARQRLTTLEHYQQFYQAKSETMQSVINKYDDGGGVSALTRSIYLGEGDAQRLVDELTGPNGVVTDYLQGATRITQAVQAALESEIKTRNELCNLLDRKPREVEFKAHIETAFELQSEEKNGPPEKIQAVLYNRTGKPLRNCVVIVRIKPDVAALSKLRQRQAQSDIGAGIVLSMFGVRGPAIQAAAELNENRIATAMLEQGDVYYIPEWKQGRKMELLLGPATAAAAWQSAELSVWSDEGRMAPRQLEAAKIAAEVNKAFDAWRKAMDRKKQYEYAKRQAEQRKQRELAAAKNAPPPSGPRRTFGGNWVARGQK